MINRRNKLQRLKSVIESSKFDDDYVYTKEDCEESVLKFLNNYEKKISYALKDFYANFNRIKKPFERLLRSGNYTVEDLENFKSSFEENCTTSYTFLRNWAIGAFYEDLMQDVDFLIEKLDATPNKSWRAVERRYNGDDEF